MSYLYFMKLRDLELQGLTRDTISYWYLVAKKLCSKKLLYVTLDHGLLNRLDNIVAYVENIRIRPSGESIVVKINTFDNSYVGGDIYRLNSDLQKIENRQFCQFGNYGKYLTLSNTIIPYDRRLNIKLNKFSKEIK